MEGVRNLVREPPFLWAFLQDFQAGEGLQTLFQTPSLKVREPHFLWFGGATSVKKLQTPSLKVREPHFLWFGLAGLLLLKSLR